MIVQKWDGLKKGLCLLKMTHSISKRLMEVHFNLLELTNLQRWKILLPKRPRKMSIEMSSYAGLRIGK
ncbi:hypothetical protein SAMN06265375_1231 [Muriicola jejuensis]|nr:hypothetical protein SAMN06265375_1231 [Muriicola jejuensis]